MILFIVILGHTRYQTLISIAAVIVTVSLLVVLGDVFDVDICE